MRDLLRSGGARIRDRPLEPRVRQRVLATLAGIQHRLELYDDAADTWNLAQASARTENFPQGDRDHLEIQRGRALLDAERCQDAREQALILIARARASQRTHLLAQGLVLLAEIDAYTGDHESGLAALDEAQPLLDRISDEQARIQWLTTRSRIDDDRGEFATAVQALEQALDLARTSWGERDLRTLTILSDLALAIGRTGDIERDERLRREVVEATESIWGEDSPGLAIALDNLGVAVRRRGGEQALHEAEALSRRALNINRDRLGDQSMHTAISANNLATVLAERGGLDEALHLHMLAVTTLNEALGPNHRSTAIASHNHARTLLLAGDLDEAEVLLEQTGQVLLATLGDQHPRYGVWQLTRAELLLARNQPDAARPLLDAAAAVLQSAQLPPGAEELTRLQRLRARLP